MTAFARPFLLLLLGLTGVARFATAQQPAPPPPAETSRLKQYEATYQSELKKLHVPLLSKYLLDLQRLYAQTSDAAGQAAIMAEIQRVQKIVAAGGVVDLPSAARSTRAPEAPSPMDNGSTNAPKRAAKAVLTLTPARARTITPAFAGDTEAARVAEISWELDQLAAGEYELIVDYSFPDIAGDLPVKATLGDLVLESKFTTMRATRDARQFRLLRVGALRLPADLARQTLTLTIGNGENGPLPSVREVIIAKAKNPKKQSDSTGEVKSDL